MSEQERQVMRVCNRAVLKIDGVVVGELRDLKVIEGRAQPQPTQQPLTVTHWNLGARPNRATRRTEARR